MKTAKLQKQKSLKMEKKDNIFAGRSSGIKKIINPYRHNEGYNCFGCSPDNAWGLRMSFYEEGDYVKSRWMPHSNFQGYTNILHGGIQTTLMDEIASWLIQVKLKTSGVTAKMETRFIKPVFIDKGQLLLVANLGKQIKQIAKVNVDLIDSDNNICTKSLITYYTFPENIARESYNYPDYEDFFE